MHLFTRNTFLLFCLIAGMGLIFTACDTRTEEEKAADELAELLAELEALDSEGYAEEEERVYETWTLPFTNDHLLEWYSTIVEDRAWITEEMQTEGVNGMIYGSGLNTEAMKYTGLLEAEGWGQWGSLEGIEKISGLPAKVEKEILVPFDWYNPELIQWGAENMIPEPDQSIAGYLAQELYDNNYSRFFRLQTESYLWLQDHGYAMHQGQYLDAMKNVDFEGLTYLENRYRGELTQYVPSYGYDSSDWLPEIAIGFWLRRGIDGTHEELWEGLRKLLVTYDADWWSKAVGKTTAEETREVKPPSTGTYTAGSDEGTLIIKEPGSDRSFYFSMEFDVKEITCGGSLEGRAYPHPAIAGLWEYDDGACVFHFGLAPGETITVEEQSGHCEAHGPRCDFPSSFSLAQE